MTVSSRILVVGTDASARASIARTLRNAGLSEVESVATVSAEGSNVPDAIVITGEDGAALCAQAREAPALAAVPILVVVPSIPPDAAAAALAAGADEIVIAPPSVAVIGNRVRRLCELASDRRRIQRIEMLQQALLRIQDLTTAGGDAPDTLRDVLLVAVAAMDFDRASLIAHVEPSEHAYVVAATDDPAHRNFALAVVDYPEVVEATRTGTPVLIDDAQNDPVTAGAVAELTRVGVRAMAVFPVMWRREALGAVSFRRSSAGVAHVTPERIAFASHLAFLMGAQLRSGAMIERLRDQTRRISRASYEAERRMRTIDSLKEHFEASADGVIVLDEDGRIVYMNRAAEAITGFARDGLFGSPLADLVPGSHKDLLRAAVGGVLSGTNLEAFDLELSTTAGEPVCVSVTTSTVLGKSGAVILSFRDVTAERKLEGELQQTNNFLGNLIDSAVDAIIAANLRGEVMLFNSGAERITGYTEEEVVGRLPVWQLYAPGVAGQVMRMLRAPEHGGVGRLEQTRREIRTKTGELVPVNMTASIIYEDGQEVATVGIFSDLRERLRIEQRLLHAQEQLELQEREAMVAQLAGAAAHELNQPLTSIMAYAQLIKRGLGEHDPNARPISVIEKEAERMADIVKKIGRITRYETKEYVGSASIIDLDKSAATSGEFRRIESSELDEDDDAFEHEETRQVPDDASGESNPYAKLISHDYDEERTQPSLRIGPYREAIERVKEMARQARAKTGELDAAERAGPPATPPSRAEDDGAVQIEENDSDKDTAPTRTPGSESR